MIPVSRPNIGKLELELVNDAVSSRWVSSLVPYINKFEESFEQFCNVKHCVATSNGTVALQLALEALGVGVSDEVIVPELTFVATANAVSHCGATPVFADVDVNSWCINPEKIAGLINAKTKAIIPVHLYGNPSAMAQINDLAKKYSLYVIEDAAEAHGAEYHGRKVGSLGDVGIFSFYGNKIITTGEGGALTTDSDQIAERARFLRDHAMDKDRRYWHTDIGFNFRITNVQAAIGVAQMRNIEKFIEIRDRILDSYRQNLRNTPFRTNPISDGCRPVNWMTCIFNSSLSRTSRDSLISRMQAKGIDCRPFFYPITAFPMYQREVGLVSEYLSRGGINLPTYVGITDNEISMICETLVEEYAAAANENRS